MLEKEGVRAAGHAADQAILAADCGTMTRDIARRGRQPDEGAPWPVALDPSQRVAADELAFVEAHCPAEARLVWIDAVVHVVAIEAQRSLESGGVARSEPGGEHPMAGSVFQDRVPDVADPIGRDEDLEAILTRVPGARHERAHARHLTWAKAEIWEVVKSLRGQELLGPRTLKCDQRQFERAVLDFNRGWRVAAHPIEISFAIGGVDDDGERIVAPVHDQVVEDSSLVIAHEVVLRAPAADAGQVVREQALQEGDAGFAGHLEATHVRDVEEPGGLAHRNVLVAYGRVLLGQLPAAEVHHASTEGDVTFEEWSSARGASRQVQSARRRLRGRWPRGR